MALLDAYVTLAEYRARTGGKATAANATLSAQLLAVARLLERSLQVAPGAFNSATGARVFDGNGKSVLRLRDRQGLQYYLQSIDADSLKIDSDLDGSYDDYTLDTADAWVRGLPANAAAHSEPFTAIELRSLMTATITAFPRLPGCVQITGTWGWAAVPGIIKELNAHLVYDLEQAQLAGGAGQLPAIDESLPLSDQTWRFWRQAERMYSRGLPVVR